MALSSSCSSLTFRRRLFGDGAKHLEDLKKSCDLYYLMDRDDKLSWLLDKKGFSVKSMYKSYKNSMTKTLYWFIWKAKIPQRIREFLWLILKDKILSKGILGKKRNGKGM